MKRWFQPTSGKRMAFFLISDFVLSLFSLFIAYELRFNFEIDPKFLTSFWLVFSVLICLKIGALYLFKSYFIVWRFFGFEEAKNLFYAHLVTYVSFSIFFVLFSELITPFPRSVIVIDFFLSLFFIVVIRAVKRLMLEQSSDLNVKEAIIIGANAKAAGIIRSAMDNQIPYYPVGIIAQPNESGNVGSYISNIKVHDYSKLDAIIEERSGCSAILTGSMTQDELKRLVDRLNAMGVTDIKRSRLLGGQEEKLEDLSIEELLARHPKDLDSDRIVSFIRGKRVAITGAGGSIGSEIARQCVRFDAAALSLIDHSEYSLYQIGEELSDAELLLINVVDKTTLEQHFKVFQPHIVIHAAAYKHVPLCEANPSVAVANNVLGSKNVIDVSIACNVARVVVISTDKAVRPTNVMGATKRVTELYAQNVHSAYTDIVCVRFGNVLGSSGSVIPKFKRQIEAGGPVTVTDPQMTRYFMLIPEACQLVLQAAAIAKGGELYILDMGEPVKIVELARQMIRLYGREDEVDIAFTGIRPGEKLYEELLIDESEKKTQYRSIFIATGTTYPIETLEGHIDQLLNAQDKVEALKRIVPEFRHTT